MLHENQQLYLLNVIKKLCEIQLPQYDMLL